MNNELKAGMGRRFKAQGSSSPEESGPQRDAESPS